MSFLFGLYKDERMIRMKKANKLLAIVLSLMLISSCIIMPAQAEQTDNSILFGNTVTELSKTTHTDDTTAITDSGFCGDKVSYELHESGTL